MHKTFLDYPIRMKQIMLTLSSCYIFWAIFIYKLLYLFIFHSLYIFLSFITFIYFYLSCFPWTVVGVVGWAFFSSCGHVGELFYFVLISLPPVWVEWYVSYNFFILNLIYTLKCHSSLHFLLGPVLWKVKGFLWNCYIFRKNNIL